MLFHGVWVSLKLYMCGCEWCRKLSDDGLCGKVDGLTQEVDGITQEVDELTS